MKTANAVVIVLFQLSRITGDTGEKLTLGQKINVLGIYLVNLDFGRRGMSEPSYIRRALEG